MMMPSDERGLHVHDKRLLHLEADDSHARIIFDLVVRAEESRDLEA